MSRFDNLELDDESPEQRLAEPAAATDETAQLLAEAQHAYASADFERGLQLYSKLTTLTPHEPEAWSGQVRLLIELGQYDQALAWGDKALEVFPEHPELLAAKAVALGRSGNLEEALALSDAAVAASGSRPYPWLARADVLLARGERRAEFSLSKALALAPADWFIAWLAARIRMFYAQFSAALQLLQAAIERDATQFVVWLAMGECQAVLGHVRAARGALDQALQLNPECREARVQLARLLNVGPGEGLRRWWRNAFSR